MTIDTSHNAQTSSNELETRATFKSFGESTKQDWDNIMVQLETTQARVADRLIEQLEYLRHDYGGFPVNRLEHCLQTATRAERDGRHNGFPCRDHDQEAHTDGWHRQQRRKNRDGRRFPRRRMRHGRGRLIDRGASGSWLPSVMPKVGPT